MQLISLSSNQTVFLKAKYIYPVLDPPFEGGGVLIEGRKIKELVKSTSKPKEAKLIDLGEVVLMPALVNAHTHIELSFLKGFIDKPSSFVSWVKKVITLKKNLQKHQIKEAAREVLSSFFNQGIGFLGDVGNSLESLELFDELPFAGVFFFEVLNFRGDLRVGDLKIPGEKYGFKIFPTAHAPHTVAPKILKELKNLSRNLEGVFSIHCAESREEVEFLLTGKGEWKKLLESRNQLPENFKPFKRTPVKHLESLEVLDEKTLLVHCIHITSEEIELVKKSGASICVCPTSNLFLQNELPRVKEFLKANINVCVGTDSGASNPVLDIWKELEILKTRLNIPEETLIKMATLNGAKALGLKHTGAIAPGFAPALIGIELKDVPSSSKSLAEALLNSKKRIRYRTYETA